MDYGVFDSLFDSVFVVDGELEIKYCNEAAAALVGSSVRRLCRGTRLSAVLHFPDKDLFIMGTGNIGKDEPMAMRELDFKIPGTEKTGKLQVTVQPFESGEGARWTIVAHDVTLEETLHTKYQGELEQKEVYIQELQEAKGQLEEYSKNLEQMVEARTQEVQRANRMLSAIMNSLGQGFLTFDREGKCSNIFTRACEEILETNPSGQVIWDVLKLSGPDLAQMKKWIEIAFAETLPFDSIVELAPTRFAHSRGRFISLNYYSLRNDKSEITSIVLVATDETREREAEQALAKEKQYIAMVLKVLRNRDQFAQYLKAARVMIQSLKQMASQGEAEFDFGEAFRILHTIEGESGLFSAQIVRAAARNCQEVIEPIKRGNVSERESSFKRLIEKLAELELSLDDFIRENREILDVLRIGESRNVEVSVLKLLDFAKSLEDQKCPEPVLRKFREDLLRQPLGTFVRHFDEVAQHVAQSENKMVKRIEFDCDRVKVSPGFYDGLFASMVHIFRNAVDHGIEPPQERVEKGKPELGTIRFFAEYYEPTPTKRWIRIIIEDDGGGIDPKMLRARLANRQGAKDLNGVSDNEVIQSIFLPGFSSRDEVGQFSGRGIGMDAVKVEVDRLGGKVRVESELGRGTKLIIELPDEPIDEPFALSA